MNYKCETCNYSTDRNFCYERHLSSNKHHEKVKEKMHETELKQIQNKNEPNVHSYKCNFCNQDYATPGSLARHKKACSEKNSLESKHQAEINKYKEKNRVLKKELEQIHDSYREKLEHAHDLHNKDIIHFKETNDLLKSDIARLQQNFNNAGHILKTSVSTNKHIMENYKTAPALSAPNDYSKLTYDRPKKHEDDNPIVSDSEDFKTDEDSDDELDEERDLTIAKNKFVEKLIYKQKKKILEDYLGKIIVRHYKKTDLEQQSLFNSDASRLTYIIRELFNDKKIDWTIDKKGIRTINCIIKPLLKHVDELIVEYIQKQTTINMKTVKTSDLVNNFGNLELSNAILTSIRTNVLAEEVLKKITPYFYFIKTDDGNNNLLK